MIQNNILSLLKIYTQLLLPHLCVLIQLLLRFSKLVILIIKLTKIPKHMRNNNLESFQINFTMILWIRQKINQNNLIHKIQIKKQWINQIFKNCEWKIGCQIIYYTAMIRGKELNFGMRKLFMIKSLLNHKRCVTIKYYSKNW